MNSYVASPDHVPMFTLVGVFGMLRPYELSMTDYRFQPQQRRSKETPS